ncbi:leucine-rich repeat serine/threonine-protein kinase 2-like isoform X2 [Actinia tenebrosa]|uniref:Leucine-rich repeat serine/threonine-protein kinase 2-like isoform X2 n=1 Tax=Actinia tenebrosa TaxID=6105 RepID=A0A6P8ITD9_ACTTE|nr:leucine-rich repeat serine/threonine-protein kinase 2-like isoform X2 [Actinia tenebrosa]
MATNNNRLYNACEKGNYDEVEARLLQEDETSKSKLLRKYFDISQNTLLHIAVINGRSRIVKLLLRHGACVNLTTGAGKYTPLHLAASTGQTECVRILLEQQDIVLSPKDDFKNTPLKGSKNETIAKLIKSKEVIKAVQRNNVERLEVALCGAQKNTFTEVCFSRALKVAVCNNQVKTEIIFKILSFAADNSCFSDLELLDCIQLVFAQDNFNVEITALLVLCWLASVEGEIWQLNFFLGISADDWLQDQSHDATLDQLEVIHHHKFHEIREMLKRKKCKDFSPAINIAMACKHTKACQMLLGHGSMHEKMCEVRWQCLGIPTLTAQIFKAILHRGPLGVCKWNNITLLDLRRNNLETIPSMIFHLPLLGTLYLDNNKLVDLPNAKWISDSLNRLYLSHNQLSHLPSVLGSSNLRTLYLDNNMFRSIPECVCKIAGLETLDIIENQLEWIPLEIGLLSKLTSFHFDPNKVVSPQGISKFRVETTKELVTWLRSLLVKMKPYTTVKLLVVGWQDKGKTTLVHRLEGDFKYFEREVTQGVEMSEFRMQQKMMVVVPTGPKVKFQVWDFAGQEDFYLMHMCFLSSVALYLLVWDLQDGEIGIEELKTWLDNIACKAVYPTTVIIVGTHLDCIPGNQAKDYTERMRELVNNMIERRPRDKIHVACVVEVSSHPQRCQGLENLRDRILKAAKEMVKDKNVRVLDQPVPISFHELVTKIEKMRNKMWMNKELPILNLDQLWSLVKETLGFKEKRFPEDEFKEAVEFLKNRGVILHFDDPNQDLRELYFIDPGWLFTLMTRAITSQSSKDGLVRKDSLFVENEEASFTEKSRERGILLLSRFYVVHILDQDTLLIPSKFSKIGPEKKMKGKKRLRRIYKMEYLPHGFFSRLIARLLHYLNSMIVEAFKDQEVMPSSSSSPLTSTSSSSPSPSPSPSSPLSSNQIPTPTTRPTPRFSVQQNPTTLTKQHQQLSPPWPSHPPRVRTPSTATTTASTVSEIGTSRAATATPSPPGSESSSSSVSPSLSKPEPIVTSLSPLPATKLVSPPQPNQTSFSPRPRVNPHSSFPEVTTVTNLREADILHWWRNGIQLNLPDAFLEVTLQQEANKSPRIVIKASRSVPGKRLLVFTIEHVEALITEWFHGLREGRVSQFVPCVVCEDKGLEDSNVFTLGDCLRASNNSDCIECPKHKDAPVPISDIAPDISLHDVHPDLLFQRHQLHYDESSNIKEGSFGKVYCAVLKKSTGSEKLVAIKEFKGDELTSFRELRKEINVLRRVVHPNLVQMVGVASKPRCMALELAEGSLEGVLFDKDSEKIPRLVLIAIAKEIANALAVLHWHKIIHRDLKPSNVLVYSLKEDDTVHVKVSDFGTANFTGPYGMRALVTRTHIRAPEVLEFALKEEYSVEVDIYSFGILLFAMITRERAFNDVPSNDIRSCILEQKRPSWRHAEGAMDVLVNLTRLMCVSWNQSSQDRPTAVQCQKQLENPGFQALMSKLAFPSANIVVFLHFFPCNEDLWVVHTINGFTFLSVFTGSFGLNSTQCFEICRNQDQEIEAICTHLDTMVVTLKKMTNLTRIFKIYSLTESSLLTTMACDSLPAINSMAATITHIFIGTDLGCFVTDIDRQTNGTLTANHLTQKPVESILVTNSKLWMCDKSSVTVYSLLEDSQFVPFYDHKDRFIKGIYPLAHAQLEEDTIWILTEDSVLKLNAEAQILCLFEVQDLFPSQTIELSVQSHVTCLLPANDTLWLGLFTGAIVILDINTRQIITSFQPYTEAVAHMVSSPDTQPPMVISCGRSPSGFLGTDRDNVIHPLAVDTSEMVKIAARKPSRVLMNVNTSFEGNWEEVQLEEFSDVLFAWHAMSCKSWKRIQRAQSNKT